MNLFSHVKAAVTTRQAAIFYSIHVDRNGMACCPFHNDRHPSMRIADRWYCFSCHETGDVIDFTAKLFNLTPLDAARKLASDFGIDPKTPCAAVSSKPSIRTQRDFEGHCASVLIDYGCHLKKRIRQYAPQDPDEEWDARFCAACHSLSYVSYLIDRLYSADAQERNNTAAALTEDGSIDRIEHWLKKQKEVCKNECKPDCFAA